MNGDVAGESKVQRVAGRATGWAGCGRDRRGDIMYSRGRGM